MQMFNLTTTSFSLGLGSETESITTFSFPKTNSFQKKYPLIYLIDPMVSLYEGFLSYQKTMVIGINT